MEAVRPFKGMFVDMGVPVCVCNSLLPAFMSEILPVF